MVAKILDPAVCFKLYDKHRSFKKVAKVLFDLGIYSTVTGRAFSAQAVMVAAKKDPRYESIKEEVEAMREKMSDLSDG